MALALARVECDAMIAACAAAGVMPIVGHRQSFDTPYLRARELIASGDLGRVRMIQAPNDTDHVYRPRRPDEARYRVGRRRRLQPGRTPGRAGRLPSGRC